jgi:hypothetical protein
MCRSTLNAWYATISNTFSTRVDAIASSKGQKAFLSAANDFKIEAFPGEQWDIRITTF